MLSQLDKELIEELKDPEFARGYGGERLKSNVGWALLEARRKTGVTQKDLAERLGLSQPYIAKLESGEANPTLGTVGRIFAALELQMVVETAPLAPQHVTYDQKTTPKEKALVARERRAKFKA
jgi:transcriptional regulator with XRE-family HTH domain